MPIKILVANAGTLHGFELAMAFLEAGMLDQYATSLFIPQGWLAWLPSTYRHSVQTRLANRMCTSLEPFVRQFPLREMLHLMIRSTAPERVSQIIEWRNKNFSKKISMKLHNQIDLVWAFDTCACELFEAARRHNIPRVLEMSTLHPKTTIRILDEISQLHPYMTRALLDSLKGEKELTRRDRELELADLVVAGSNRVKLSAIENGVNSKKIIVNRYGVDVELFSPGNDIKKQQSFVFIFVGRLSQQKGIGTLLEAWKISQFSIPCELWLVGSGAEDLTTQWQGLIPASVRLIGRLPHHEVVHLLQQAHVFVFPSLFEGFSRAILEAMACGLPIIGTKEIVEEIVANGISGLHVPAGNAFALSQSMVALAEDSVMRKQMATSARAAVASLTWVNYRERARSIAQKLSYGELP